MTVDDLWHEWDRGRFFECSLRSQRDQIDGIQQGEDIYVDPRPAILETVIHEMLHRRYRRWGEKRVRRESQRLVLSMDESTKRRWYAAYRRVVRKRAPVDCDDDAA